MKKRRLIALFAFFITLGLVFLEAWQPPRALAQYSGTCPSGNGLFVLYYGYIQDPASGDSTLQTIMSKQPNFVIFGSGLQDRSDIPTYVHQNSGRAIQYIPLGYGNNSSTDVDAQVTTAMNAGYDGVFFDETDPNKYDWNTARAAHVRSYGSSKLVIVNPGVASPPQSVFDYADIASVENQYNQALPSYTGIASWRWLAVQGDPASQAAPSASEAQNRTTTFRNNGGFWYYSSDYAATTGATDSATHIYLPSWYGTFADWVKSQSAPSCSSIMKPQAINDATNVYYSFQYSGTWNSYQVFIDTDQNSSTGFVIGGIGADYLLENDKLYQHGGGEWNWNQLKTVTYSSTNNSASWAVVRSDIGETAASGEKTDLVFKLADSGGNGPSLSKFTQNYT